MTLKYILDFLPFFILILMLMIPAKRGRVTNIALWLSVFYIFLLVIIIAGYPNDPNNITDRDRYEKTFYNISAYGLDFEYKDVGWIFYNIVCVWFFGDNLYMLWLTTAVIYVLSYFSFALSYFDKKKIFYFLVMTTGILGFTSYGTNTLRQGLATACVLYALRRDTKFILKILLFIFALTFHKSIILPIISLIASSNIKNYKCYIYLWVSCLLFSVANFSLTDYMGNFVDFDKRIEGYGDSLGGTSGYKTGFRLDFVLYSIVPMVYSYYYVNRYKIQDAFYNIIVRMYLFSNAIWLLVIRIPFTDRVGYLSWFLIPFMTLYPLLTYSDQFKNVQRKVLLTMSLFMSVYLFITIKAYLR